MGAPQLQQRILPRMLQSVVLAQYPRSTHVAPVRAVPAIGAMPMGVSRSMMLGIVLAYSWFGGYQTFRREETRVVVV